jgi:hypothetical protein
MRTTREIPPASWQEYFEGLTRRHQDDGVPRAATVEVLSPRLGDQFEAITARLLGLTYDPRSRVLEVLLEDLDHLSFRPAQIWVIEDEGGYASALELLHWDGSKEIIYVQRTGPPAPAYAQSPPR